MMISEQIFFASSYRIFKKTRFTKKIPGEIGIMPNSIFNSFIIPTRHHQSDWSKRRIFSMIEKGFKLLHLYRVVKMMIGLTDKESYKYGQSQTTTIDTKQNI